MGIIRQQCDRRFKHCEGSIIVVAVPFENTYGQQQLST
jgi:hypothetical protein